MSNFDAFKEIFQNTFEEFLEVNRIRKETQDITKHIDLLYGCISANSRPEYPIIVGNGLSRASISNLGTFPPYKHTRTCIFPLNYTVKKRFRPHRNYKKSLNNKVLYVCTVENDGIVITADDEHTWKGNKAWSHFVADLEITDEFSSLEDFMGLTNPTVIKMIEKIGSPDMLEGYVQLDKR